jgi:signal transduction histidine kinase
MKQVFWNLATNALKAMPDGGTLTLRVTDGDDGVQIAFCDEGIGMTEEDLERYFQPFRGAFVVGTGLGAAIVYRIVEEHGGAVTLSSRPGAGTDVLITLPAKGTPARTHRGGRARHGHGARSRRLRMEGLIDAADPRDRR